MSWSPPRAPGGAWTLEARLTTLLSLLVAAGIALLFVLIDRSVARQYDTQAQRQRAEVLDSVRAALQREARQLGSLAEVAASDSDLVHATFYHLHLDGERGHPQAAVERLGRTLGLERIALRSPRGDIVAAAPEQAAKPDASSAGGFAWIGDEAWILAAADLRREGRTLATLQIARRVAPLLAAGLPPGVSAQPLRETGAGVGPSSIVDAQRWVARVDMPQGGTAPGGALALQLGFDNPAASALSDVKSLLTWVLPLLGLAGVGVVRAVVKRELSPLVALTGAASEIGQGDWQRELPPARGSAEVRTLVEAFASMLAGLRRMRLLEQQVQRDQQLNAIGRMAARVAHDINNPLTVIHNIACLMQRNPAAIELLGEDVELLRHHSERCQRTTQGLLQFGRPVQLRCERTPVGRIVQAAVDRWAAVEGRCPATVALGEGAFDEAALDAYQIEMLLDNLLNNACAAGAGAPVEVHVARRGSELRVAVRDQGPGFSAQARARVFEPFFTTKAGGSGLGLSSALMIARAHGGDLAIGEGPRGEVVLSLPIAEATAGPGSVQC